MSRLILMFPFQVAYVAIFLRTRRSTKKKRAYRNSPKHVCAICYGSLAIPVLQRVHHISVVEVRYDEKLVYACTSTPFRHFQSHRFPTSAYYIVLPATTLM